MPRVSKTSPTAVIDIYCEMENVLVSFKPPCFQHIDSWTKWQLYWGEHFQMHFGEITLLYFDKNSTDVRSHDYLPVTYCAITTDTLSSLTKNSMSLYVAIARVLGNPYAIYPLKLRSPQTYRWTSTHHPPSADIDVAFAVHQRFIYCSWRITWRLKYQKKQTPGAWIINRTP